ncbi:MAG: hypothetical protein V3W34_14645 [Phycisphaerae bacterium]
MGSPFPDWLKYVIVSALALAAGVVVGASFTMRERAGLEAEVRHAQTQVAQAKTTLASKDASIAELSAQLDSVGGRIAHVNEQLSRFEERLSEAESRIPLVLSFASIEAPPPLDLEQVNSEPIADAKPSEVVDERCTAITLKGTRCKRRAKDNGSGKCWQHQD